MFKSALVLILLLSSYSLHAQDMTIERYSWRLAALGYDMVECRQDKDRDSCLALFNLNMDSLIAMPGSYAHRFDSVENVLIMDAPDKKFRLLTWGFRHPNDSFSFFGIIQYADEKRPPVYLTDSAHKLGNRDSTYMLELGPEEWFGALYYQIEKVTYKRETYYLLLGWNGNTQKTDRKILEVLYWNEADEPRFGLPVFDMGNKMPYQYRVIWEYKNGANMALKMEVKKKLITFEHIEPADPRAKGIYTLYLPDGTYDFFRYKKGIWIKGSMLYDNDKNPGSN
ncbi:MAG: hypothetical protein ACYC1Q_09835 [Bacteroidia bacterium]